MSKKSQCMHLLRLNYWPVQSMTSGADMPDKRKTMKKSADLVKPKPEKVGDVDKQGRTYYSRVIVRADAIAGHPSPLSRTGS